MLRAFKNAEVIPKIWRPQAAVELISNKWMLSEHACC